MAEKMEYSYPVEELDAVLEKMSKGIEPMGLSDDFKKEVKLRYMELNENSMDDDQYEEYQKTKQEVIHEKIEKKRREATKRDVVVIRLSDAQLEQLKEDMSCSIVRQNPNLQYHLSDDKIFDSDEKRVIYHKLSRLKNCYYNAADYVAAMKVIYDAIAYSLDHDYPWMTHGEAVQAFNNGEIKFAYCNIPKLYVNWNTQITDKEILKGIMTGEVILKSKDEDKPERKVNKDYKPIDVDYTVTGTNQYQQLVELQNHGIDTPMAPALRAKNGSFNRFALPGNNRFYVDQTKQSNVPQSFDWTQPNAGIEYYNLVNGIKYTTHDVIRDVNSANGNNLNQLLSANTSSFLRLLKTSGTQVQPTAIHPLSVSNEAAELEKSILHAMRMNNPNL